MKNVLNPKRVLIKSFILFIFGILIINFNIAHGDSVNIPEWVFDVHGFWTEKRISDNEFSNTLTYLENNNIIDLILHQDYDVQANFLLSILSNENVDQYTKCSDDWYVTGYFVPVEADYSDKFVSIFVNNETREFKEDFVDDIKIEGWGRTLSEDYLGWYDDSFHINDKPVDLDGNQLVVGKIAVDNLIIDHDAKLIISTLPEPWKNIVFLSSDEGTSIKGKHIDLFTGEGKLAENETFRITSYDNKVCE